MEFDGDDTESQARSSAISNDGAFSSRSRLRHRKADTFACRNKLNSRAVSLHAQGAGESVISENDSDSQVCHTCHGMHLSTKAINSDKPNTADVQCEMRKSSSLK